MIRPDETISVPGVGGRKAREIERRYLCEIIEARAEEIIRIVAEELEQLGALFPGGAHRWDCKLSWDGGVDRQVLGIPAARGEPIDCRGCGCGPQSSVCDCDRPCTLWRPTSIYSGLVAGKYALNGAVSVVISAFGVVGR